VGKQNQNKFLKRQKELERMRKAQEKIARRQHKGARSEETGEPETAETPAPTANQQPQSIS
jgi:hypothetical protein